MTDPTLMYRLAVLTTSGFDTEAKMADSILKFVDRVGRELLAGGKLSESQKRGILSALNHTPIAFSALTALPLPDDDRNVVTFILAKLIDDMLDLGAIAIVADNKEMADRISAKSSDGGRKGAKKRQDNRAAWQNKTLELAQDILNRKRNYGQESMAVAIGKKWNPDWGKLPKREKTIIEFLSHSLRDGALIKPPAKEGR